MPDDLTRLPPIAASRVAALLARVDAAAPGLVEAAWIEGSIALGDFRPTISDVDVRLVTSRAPPRPMRLRGWRGPVLQVDWSTWDHLASLPATNAGAVSAATLHRAGIAVRGPSPRDVVPDVDHATLAARMGENLDDYWAPWLQRAQHDVVGGLLALHPRRVEWGVVGVPRLHVTIVEGRIASKTAAIAWARERYDARWRPILDEAMRLRAGAPGCRYASPFARRRDLLAFVAHAIEAARAS